MATDRQFMLIVMMMDHDGLGVHIILLIKLIAPHYIGYVFTEIECLAKRYSC